MIFLLGRRLAELPINLPGDDEFGPYVYAAVLGLLRDIAVILFPLPF